MDTGRVPILAMRSMHGGPQFTLRERQYSTKYRTLAAGTDLIRPTQAYDLHQRPSLTVLQLVHTEEVARRSVLTRRRHGLTWAIWSQTRSVRS